MDEGGRRRLSPDDLHWIAAVVAPLVLAQIRQPQDGHAPVKGKDYDDGRPGKDCDMAAVRDQVSRFLAALPRAKAGDQGDRGEDGWSPELAVVPHGDRRVIQVVAWFGGGGSMPDVGWYLGPAGFTKDIDGATDIRGETGRPDQAAGASNTALKRLIRSIGGGGLTTAQVIELIEERMVYSEPEYLDDQTTDSDGLATFTFSEAVDKVWVELHEVQVDDEATARVRVDGGDPDADTGTLIHAGVPHPITASATTVKVFAEVGKTISCWGYRR